MSADPNRLDAVLADLVKLLAGCTDSPRLEAELLLAAVLGRARSHLHARPERPIDANQRAAARTLARRRMAGEPMAYVLGRREFWSLDLMTTPAALIPRADSERLVELALERAPPASRVADLGTGTGAIALALAHERPDLELIATDVDGAALRLAAANARRLGLQGRVQFRRGDWFAPLAGERVAMVVSNPPYVAIGDPHLEADGLQFEPRHALVSGVDGMEHIRTLVRDASSHLLAGGWLLIEHGHTQSEAVTSLLLDHGFVSVQCWRDLNGHPRVGGGQRPDSKAGGGGRSR